MPGSGGWGRLNRGLDEQGGGSDGASGCRRSVDEISHCAQPKHVEVLEGDVRSAPLPASSFDLVHARYVLIHLPDYEAVLSRILAYLKPGGWLVLEEPDFSASRGITGDAGQMEAVINVNQAIKTMYDTLGMDYALELNCRRCCSEEECAG